MSDDPLAELRRAYEVLDRSIREQWDRSLPLQDAVIDRWSRATELGFGEGASIYGSALVYGDVTVGAHTWVGPNVLLDGTGGGLHIGAWCSISAGVHVYTHDTVLWALSGGQAEAVRAPVRIGDRSYVGSQTVVVAGATIGSQCVVAANSVVRGAVPDRTVVAGSPAVAIGRVVVDGDRITLDYGKG